MRKQITIGSSILLLVALSIIYFTLPDQDSSNTIQEQSNAKSSKPEEEQVEVQDEPLSGQQEEPNTTITEEIKEKVKQVVGDTVELFLKDDLNIVAIGDSLTQGVGDETGNGGYVGILHNTFASNDPKIDIKNYGKRGNRSDQLLDRLEQPEIIDSVANADIVLITIGANDIMKVVQNNFTNLRQEPFNDERIKYRERLHLIFDTIISINPNVEIFMIGFYNPFEKYFSDIEQLGMILNDWNTTAETVTNSYDQISFIPTKDLFQLTNKNLLADDNFHPNAAGYRLMAERVLTYLRPSIIKETDS